MRITEGMIDALADVVQDIAENYPEYTAWAVWGFGDAIHTPLRHPWSAPDRADSMTDEEHKLKTNAWKRGCEAAGERSPPKAELP